MTRFAAIADVHGNCLALEAVLADIGRQGVTDIVNLGDHVGGPLEAARTADLLMARGFPSVRGNHDRMVVQKSDTPLGLSDQAALAQLRPHHLDWLRAMPPTLLWRGEVLLCHGTPTSDDTYWMERVEANGSVRMAAQAEIEAEAKGCDHPVILCGHTHIPRAVRLRDGRLIVNPGSVGLPAYDHDVPRPHVMETGAPDARYAILQKTGRHWSAALRQVVYDHEAMASMARKAGRLDWAQGLSTGWMG